ncbi:MAG: aspartyl/glutamyl-tRNA amidotransferase subunit A [Candidatus Margulisbacteria bacterium GWF2_35_9]|nr:MAG: aspartyl/glutamyl-tRNA amidotransferase subunit A [Candidatus Margulisbacteria bacterium GWF2_35_9]
MIHLNAHELFNKIKNKEVSALELTNAFITHSKKTNAVLNSYNLITEEIAINTANRVDKKIATGEKLEIFEGVPIAIKDNICIEDIETTCSSKILEGFKPPYNATIIEKLNAMNMPIIGKTNMDEFAMGSSTETSFYGVSKNPWDISTVPGGSSGGSAVAVASGQAPLSIGSDTGGSIRQPASFCGIVGVKPTYGRISRYGLMAFASSLDQIGPFSKTVEDSAHLLNILCGYDFRDSTSQNVKAEDFTRDLNRSIKGIKVAIPKELYNSSLSKEVKDYYDQLINKLSNEGIIFEEIELPSLKYALSTYYIIAPAEASSNLSRYDGVRYGYRSENANSLIEMMTKSRSEGFGDEVKRRILIGNYVLSSGYYDAYYKKAQQVRTLIKEDYKKAFETYDVILSPTTPTPAFKPGEKTANPLEMYLNDIMTIPVNLAGLPAISIPCGMVNNLPMGLQLTGNVFEESKLLGISNQLEKILCFKLNNSFIEGVL